MATARRASVSGHDALKDERAIPLFDEIFSIRPGDRRIKLGIHVINDGNQSLRTGAAIVGKVREFKFFAGQIVVCPAPMRGKTEHAVQRQFWWHDHAGFEISLAIAGHKRVNGQTQGVILRRPCSALRTRE